MGSKQHLDLLVLRLSTFKPPDFLEGGDDLLFSCT